MQGVEDGIFYFKIWKWNYMLKKVHFTSRGWNGGQGPYYRAIQKGRFQINKPEFCSNKGLSFLKPQIHPEWGKRVPPPSLTWTTIVCANSQRHQLASTEELMWSLTPRSPRLQAVCCWSLKSPWWMKLHLVMHPFGASHWLSGGNVRWRADLPLQGKPLIYPSQEETPVLQSESKLKRVRFSAAFFLMPQETNHGEKKPQGVVTPALGKANEEEI